MGSGIVTAVAMVIAVPVGLGSAIYLSEYARPSVRKVLKPTLEILAGIPSVVLGFFAISVISPEIVQRFFGATRPVQPDGRRPRRRASCRSRWWPRCRRTRSAACPLALREASYGMGARKITTTVRVVLPAAVSGLVAAFILAVSRAIGETMVVFIAGGAGGGSLFNYRPVRARADDDRGDGLPGHRHGCRRR